MVHLAWLALSALSLLLGTGSLGRHYRPGVVAGAIKVCGGGFSEPAGGPTRRTCSLQRGSVSVFAYGRRVAPVTLRRGRFRFLLRRGLYQLVAWNQGNGPWRRTVWVVAGRATAANVVIPVLYPSPPAYAAPSSPPPGGRRQSRSGQTSGRALRPARPARRR